MNNKAIYKEYFQSLTPPSQINKNNKNNKTRQHITTNRQTNKQTNKNCTLPGLFKGYVEMLIRTFAISIIETPV